MTSERSPTWSTLAALGAILGGCGSSAPDTAGPETDASLESAGDAPATPDAPDEGAGDAARPPTDAAPTTDAADSTGAVDAAAPVQSLAIPMYMDPSAADWAQETSAAPTVSFLVANPNSGPGAAAQTAYTQAIATAHAAGQTIVGYVHTSYGARPIAQVEADIDAWYAFYPSIDGIFSDETATDKANVSPYYAPLYAYVKAKAGKRLVVVNPGTPPDEAYMSASDVVLSFEDTYANYANAATPPWVAGYPRSRFWHIVLSTAASDLAAAVALARARNAGLVYVTDQGPSTAYSQLVTGAYWQAELAAVNAP